MKVKELKKINEFAHENGFTLDYKKIVIFDTKDISRILELIDKKSINVESLIKFFKFEISNPDWKKKFEHIRGIEAFDIREYIIDKISNANSLALSKAIYDYFDGECADILILFKDVQEYQTYVESITAEMDDNDNTVLSNVQFVLERVPLNLDRNEVIKNVMEYSQRNDLSPTSLRDYFENLEFQFDINETLLLLLKGYDIRRVSSLLENWHEDIKNGDKDKVHGSYEIGKKYLLKSELFSYMEDNKSLIEIFCTTEYEEYEQIVTLLEKVEKAKDKELFDQCLKLGSKLSNENKKYYINEILKIGSSNGDFRYSLFALLKNKISEDNKAKAVLEVVRASNKVDFSSRRTTKFIIDLQKVDLIIDMPITKENHDTREVIYREFPKCVAHKKLNRNQTEYYSDLLKRLCSLRPDICEKVMDILSLPLVKDMDIEQQIKLRELIFTPENYGSLEYIYARYKEKDKEYNLFLCQNAKSELNVTSYDPEVSLMTVAKVLESAVYFDDIDKILDGFDDDEEITPRTLIRSLAYKNNQNN